MTPRLWRCKVQSQIDHAKYHPPAGRWLEKTPRRFPLGVRKHFRRVDILPPSLADIDRPHLSLCSHQPHAIGHTTIIVFERALQVSKDDFRAEKNSGIDGVIVFELLSNRDDQTIL